MSSVLTVTMGLNAALRLARGRADGVVLVPNDLKTIIRSFWSIPLCLPAVVIRLFMSWASTGIPNHAGYLVGREVLVFVVGWLIFVEITHRIAPLLGQAERWGRFIALWNWCNVIEGLLVVVGGIPGTFGAPAIVDQACTLITIGWALWLEWYATRLTLGVTSLTATLFVLMDQAIGIILASVVLALTT